MVLFSTPFLVAALLLEQPYSGAATSTAGERRRQRILKKSSKKVGKKSKIYSPTSAPSLEPSSAPSWMPSSIPSSSPTVECPARLSDLRITGADPGFDVTDSFLEELASVERRITGSGLSLVKTSVNLTKLRASGSPGGVSRGLAGLCFNVGASDSAVTSQSCPVIGDLDLTYCYADMTKPSDANSDSPLPPISEEVKNCLALLPQAAAGKAVTCYTIVTKCCEANGIPDNDSDGG